MSSCVRLGDLNGDGDHKLCICDIDKKLKVYKGTSLIVEYALLDVPISMCIIYTDIALPRIPSIAVAAGPHIFIYRQLRPYKKWTCPPVDIAAAEIDVWNNIRTESIDLQSALKSLSDIRDSGLPLSSRSIDLLSFDTDLAKQNFVYEMKDIPYAQHTLITCMETLKKTSEDIDAISLLIVGTESGQVFILPQDPNNSSFLCKINLPSVPVLLSASGLFDVEWRVFVTCRDGKLYSIKSGDVRGTAVLSGAVCDLGSQPVAVARQDKLLWVATMDKLVSCYTTRGKRTKILTMPEEVTELCAMTSKRSKLSHLLIVAMANGEVRIFREAALVDVFKLEGPVQCLRFGMYGREEGVLVVVHGRGSLTVKMWRRMADVENVNLAAGPPPEQDIPLPVPKKTKLYVEQTQREREQAPAMHRAFQRDLCRLRLDSARAYVKTLTDGQMGASPLGSSEVRVHVQVQGLGPLFLLKISLQNSGSQPVMQSSLLLSFDPELYSMPGTGGRRSLSVPMLLPGPKYVLDAELTNIDPQGRAGQVLLLLYHPSSASSLPLLSASVRMPSSELLTV